MFSVFINIREYASTSPSWDGGCYRKRFLFHLLQEAKKKYDKETEKYCAVLEKHLSLSARKKESHLHEVPRT